MAEGTDNTLLELFDQEVWSKVPHLEEKDGEVQVVNATPLVDLTADFKECAKSVFKINLDDTDLKVYGKQDSTLLTGSIKVRPAQPKNGPQNGGRPRGPSPPEETIRKFIKIGLFFQLTMALI